MVKSLLFIHAPYIDILSVTPGQISNRIEAGGGGHTWKIWICYQKGLRRGGTPGYYHGHVIKQS